MKRYFGCAQRGRYQEDDTIQQKIEVSEDELSNAITTVQKDSLVVEKRQQNPRFIGRKRTIYSA